MHYDFSYSMDGGPAVFLIIMAIAMIPGLAVGVLSYILSSLGLYSIAKRRQIAHPWLSWIPVGSSWVLGSVSDQFRYVVRGETRSKRKLLLVLNILYSLLVLAMLVTVIVMLGAVVRNTVVGGFDEDAFLRQFVQVYSSLMGFLLPIYGMSIALAIIRYMALYDLYTSCDPRYRTLYLVLGILINITEPCFIFVCRNKDIGMPPRKELPHPQPVYSPEYL